jgi:hypothetical protein
MDSVITSCSLRMKNFKTAQRKCWPFPDSCTFTIAILVTLLSGLSMTVSACGGTAVATDSPTTSQGAPAQWKHLEDPAVGFSLDYPANWSVEGQAIATQFAVGARCRSVRLIDFESPPDSGAAAPMQQSFMQVCAKPLEQHDSLDQYMQRVYGASLDQTFEIKDLNGARTYQAKIQGYTRTIFAQAKDGLIQIVASVATSPDKFPERKAQVERILASLSLI